MPSPLPGTSMHIRIGAALLSGLMLLGIQPALAQSETSVTTQDNTPVQQETSDKSADTATQHMQSTTPGTASEGTSDTEDPPPSKQLPEPSSDDYGADSFNAPSDSELDRSAATHSLPGSGSADNSQDNDGKGDTEATPQPMPDE